MTKNNKIKLNKTKEDTLEVIELVDGAEAVVPEEDHEILKIITKKPQPKLKYDEYIPELERPSDDDLLEE